MNFNRSPLLAVLLFAGLCISTAPGCAGKRQLDPAGVYQGDNLLWEADGAILEVNKACDDIQALAVRNPGPFASNAKLKDLLAKVKKERDGTPRPDELLTQLFAARDAYKASKTAGNATVLQNSLSVARSFLDQARLLVEAIPR